ncbi:MAG: DUF6446 family protein [Pseudomonadota bacterium]
MKSGTVVGLAVAAATLIGGAAVYYLQAFEYYERRDGLESVVIGGEAFAVQGYRGLDHDALPLRLRGCFRVSDPEAALAAGPAARRPEPFGAPSWFECWNAEALDEDLKAGRARAVSAEISGSGDFATERVVAIYPDGRAFQWRRLMKDVR